MTCEICPIIQEPSDFEQSMRLISTDFWHATLRNEDQSLLGTSFITARRHVPSLADLTRAEQQDFFDVHTQLETALKKAFGAAVINTSCLMNHAFRNALPEPHVHWHVKPRYSHTVDIEGLSFSDPSFGSYLDGLHDRRPVSDSQALAIVGVIKKFL